MHPRIAQTLISITIAIPQNPIITEIAAKIKHNNAMSFMSGIG